MALIGQTIFSYVEPKSINPKLIICFKVPCSIRIEMHSPSYIGQWFTAASMVRLIRIIERLLKKALHVMGE